MIPWSEPVGADHSRTCSIFSGRHEQSRDGRPGRFCPVPCDCEESARERRYHESNQWGR